MTHEEFFNWLRSMQDDKRLSQNEVDTANELLKTTTPERLKAWLIEVNDWDTEQSKVGFMQLSKTGVNYKSMPHARNSAANTQPISSA